MSEPPKDPFVRDDPRLQVLDEGRRLFEALVDEYAADWRNDCFKAINSLSKEDLRMIVYERVSAEGQLRYFQQLREKSGG